MSGWGTLTFDSGDLTQIATNYEKGIHVSATAHTLHATHEATTWPFSEASVAQSTVALSASRVIEWPSSLVSCRIKCCAVILDHQCHSVSLAKHNQ